MTVFLNHRVRVAANSVAVAIAIAIALGCRASAVQAQSTAAMDATTARIMQRLGKLRMNGR